MLCPKCGYDLNRLLLLEDPCIVNAEQALGYMHQLRQSLERASLPAAAKLVSELIKDWDDVVDSVRGLHSGRLH